MYKIYINETPLYLTTPKGAEPLGPSGEKVLVLNYAGKKKYLINIVHQLESSKRFERVVVFSNDLEALWADFLRIFKLIPAAGGAVFNEKKLVLAIFRRETWDLPKGKIDNGESPEQAAVREVMEEVGLTEIKLGQHLLDTWHTYRENDKRILKRTYWYLMQTTQTELTPQTEEDIEKAAWVQLDEIIDYPSGHIYGNILDVLRAAKSSFPNE